jgi:nucleotide-binding universal stress UspA family protein
MTSSPRRARQWAGFQSVLCAVDFSENSGLALRYAEAIASRGRARLTVTYAIDPLLIAAAAAALHDRNIATRTAAELEEFIAAALTANSRKRLRVTSNVTVGSPPDEILKAAARVRADVVVVGTHGLTGVDRLIVGSTTMRILQRTTVPVLAVPRRGGNLAAMLSQWPGKRIVSALDLDGDSRTNVDVAAHVARWFGSSLLLLHVIKGITAPAWMQGDLSAHERIRVAQAQQQIDALAAVARNGLTVETRVACGHIADEIAAFVAADRTELVITALGVQGRWFGAHRGSVSYHVLSHAVAPVLACPRQWRPR